MQIAPQLSVRRGRAAVDFHVAAFGAVEQYRVGGTDDHEDVVSLLSVAARAGRGRRAGGAADKATTGIEPV